MMEPWIRVVPGSGKKWEDSGCVVKIEVMGFVDGLHVELEEQRFQVFDLSNEKGRIVI